MRTYKSESELVASLKNKFLKYSDFTIVQEERIRLKDITMILDIVIKYGGKPIACAEFKTKENSAHITKHIETILKYSEIRFFFAVVNDSYKYYESSSGNLVDMNEDEILEMLLNSVNNNSELCNELRIPFLKLICDNKHQWGKYGNILSDYINKGELKRYGNHVFFDDVQEKNFFRELLLTTSKGTMPKVLCRYTSAKSFYLSLKNGFRISSVEAMNDEFETKVIDNYPNLQSVKTELSDYLYQGFIMSFSKIGRKDKLLQWYMYGDQAKGVCFIVEPKDKVEVLWAPVVYIPKKKDTNTPTLLDFLNQLLGLKIDNTYSFKFRFWHYWKYFFKYDFYKEEEEVRLLVIQKEKGSTDWSEGFDMPYHYILKKRDEMLFDIKKVIFGPKCSKKNLKNAISEALDKNIDITASEIIGYR